MSDLTDLYQEVILDHNRRPAGARMHIGNDVKDVVRHKISGSSTIERERSLSATRICR